jgi:hypothetical protein
VGRCQIIERSGLSDGTCTDSSSYRQFFYYCSCTWAAQLITGIFHLGIHSYGASGSYFVFNLLFQSLTSSPMLCMSCSHYCWERNLLTLDCIQVTFESLWSRHTHPKDFPLNGTPTRFSDVIGASHSADYQFWNYGNFASEGLRQVAERGATRMLESELKAQVSWGNRNLWNWYLSYSFSLYVITH